MVLHSFANCRSPIKQSKFLQAFVLKGSPLPLDHCDTALIYFCSSQLTFSMDEPYKLVAWQLKSKIKTLLHLHFKRANSC